MDKKWWLLIACLFPLTAFSQKKADRKILAGLQQNILGLSADSISNEAGSFQSLQKVAYLESQFRAMDISPVNNTFRQVIIYDEGKKFMPGTRLSLNGNILQPEKDFIPLPYSAQATAQGEPLIAVQERDQPWTMDLNNYLTNGQNQGLATTLYKLAKQAVHDKASAVLFYNSTGSTNDLSFNPKENFSPLSIPVVYINNAAAKVYFKDPTNSIHVELTVAFSEKKDTGYNVIGSINNNAPQTILLGAYKTGDKAALLELGRLLKNNKHYNRNNYLLVAFAGKKNGISGAQYFLQHPPVDLTHLRCFIALRHTGELNVQNPVLSVREHTSSEWKAILDKIRNKNIIIKENSGSDDSFPVNCPVLFVYASGGSGVHAAGELEVVKYMAEVIREINRTTR